MSIKLKSLLKESVIRLYEADYKVKVTVQTSFPKDKAQAMDIAIQAASGDPDSPLVKAMEKGDPEKLKKWTEQIGGVEELAKRIVAIAEKIPTTGLEKKDMPFLPGPDDAEGSVDDVEDALTPGGKYNADVVKSKIATPKPNELGSVDSDDNAVTWMNSGQKDGDPNDDKVDFKKKPKIAAKKAEPTQTNILLPKAMGMAVNGVNGGDLGAYFSAKGEILDGHHRWAATMLNDPNANLIGFAYIDLDAMGGKIPGLQKLTAIGNALGNKTKTESINKNRWHQIANIKKK